MTLNRYDADDLDEVAMAILDVASNVRNMSKICRTTAIRDVQINDRKAREWIEKLNDWSRKALSDLEARRVQENLATDIAAKQARSKARRARRR